ARQDESSLVHSGKTTGGAAAFRAGVREISRIRRQDILAGARLDPSSYRERDDRSDRDCSYEGNPMTPLSILELVRVTEDTDAKAALNNARDLAVHAEKWGYSRIWVAEHHNMEGIASAATSIVIGHIADGTSTIRVGAGGIMLPNHAPYIIAEQSGTLEPLYPGRIDLGLGRAPGTDQIAVRAMRRAPDASDRFPQDVLELQAFLAPAQPDQRIIAVPAAGTNVPLWILGSSAFGASMAAEFGLPYAFASHFAPAMLMQALDIYRSRFKPSEQLDRPYAMAGINVIAADTDAEARRLWTTQQ